MVVSAALPGQGGGPAAGPGSGGEPRWARAIRESAPYVGIGSSLAFTLLLCLWAGHWADRKLGTEPLFFLVGGAFGLFAAFVQLYKAYRAFSGPKKR